MNSFLIKKAILLKRPIMASMSKEGEKNEKK
jgi:hypothetical protein